jgi:hypothetical protein
LFCHGGRISAYLLKKLWQFVSRYVICGRCSSRIGKSKGHACYTILRTELVDGGALRSAVKGIFWRWNVNSRERASAEPWGALAEEIEAPIENCAKEKEACALVTKSGKLMLPRRNASSQVDRERS